MAKHLFAAVTHRHTAACAGLSKHDKCAWKRGREVFSSCRRSKYCRDMGLLIKQVSRS